MDAEPLPPHLVALIAAAIKAVLPEAHAIVSITPSGSHWAMEGRRQIFSGRNFR